MSPTYALSGEADRDIDEILRFTKARWGLRQAERYGGELHATFDLLAGAPEIGKRIDHIRAGYRRFEHRSHSIYYVTTAGGVTIMRVLHGRMLSTGRL